MKRSAIAMGIVLLLLGLVTTANAIPLYYTFQGVVTTDWLDHANLAVDNSNPHIGPIPIDEQLYLGDYVHHRVLLDYDLSSLPDLNEPHGPWEPIEHRFSVQYVDGTAMVSPNRWNSGGYNVFNAIGDHVPGSLFSGATLMGIGDGIFGIYSEQMMVYDWTVGTIVHATSYFGAYGGTLRETLVLTDISPIPEPSTVLLIGTGLVSFAVPRIRRKFKR